MRSNFFELGGHSLLSVRLVAKIQKHFAKSISIKSIFETPSLGALALLIEQSEAVLQPISKISEQHTLLSTSFAQQRMWFIDQMQEGRSAEYNMPLALRIFGHFDVDKAVIALKKISQKHQVLRCVYIQTREGLKQVDSKRLITLKYHDLSALPYDEREKKLIELVEQDASTSFRLDTELPIRVQLLKLAFDEQNLNEVALLLNIHHSVSDGWSYQVLLEAFCSYYNFVDPETNPDTPLSIQYADYAHWQHQKMLSGGYNTALKYWQQQLTGAPLCHSLELDMPRQSFKQTQGGRIRGTLSVSQVKAIQALSQSHGITPFMFLHGALALLIARHSGVDDIVIGTPVANRIRYELEPLIGMFVNTLALRVNTAFEQISDYWAHLKDVHLNAQTYQELPFDQVVESLNIPRSEAYNPVFQIMFALDEQFDIGSEHQLKLELVGCDIKAISREGVTAKFDLDVSCHISEQGAELTWTFDRTIFKATHIEQLMRHYSNLLNSLIASANSDCKTLNILSPEEVADLTRGIQGVQQAQPTAKPIHQQFCAMAAAQGNEVAVVHGVEQITYAQLERHANVIASLLKKKCLPQHAVVAIHGNRSIELICSIIGVLKAGG
ncbi:condensation domain-containing protein, partial [Shewanella sp.]|uniref:condensation domain-containing protein n=1 Tax=Shewanella sp. TaxID=50422 RepID=UPI004053CCC3